MNRQQLTPGRNAWVALGPLALGMVLALGASPVAAIPTTPATGFGASSPVSPVNGGIPVSDLDAAERLTGLGERYLEQHALADAEAAFRGALAIVEAALGPTDPQLADPMTRSEEHTSELQSQSNLVCRLLLEKKKKTKQPELETLSPRT